MPTIYETMNDFGILALVFFLTVISYYTIKRSKYEKNHKNQSQLSTFMNIFVNCVPT